MKNTFFFKKRKNGKKSRKTARLEKRFFRAHREHARSRSRGARVAAAIPERAAFADRHAAPHDSKTARKNYFLVRLAAAIALINIV